MPNYVSSVEIKISKEEDGRFKGHIILPGPGGEHMLTVPNKDRAKVVSQTVGEAKTILGKDNVITGATPGSTSSGGTGSSSHKRG